MVIKKNGVDFGFEMETAYCSPALTLRYDEVCDLDEPIPGTYTKTHADRWTITGVVHEDYYCWVNEFSASHPLLGEVWGDFEGEVYATSELAFRHFYHYHKPEAWDYWDI